VVPNFYFLHSILMFHSCFHGFCLDFQFLSLVFQLLLRCLAASVCSRIRSVSLAASVAAFAASAFASASIFAASTFLSQLLLLFHSRVEFSQVRMRVLFLVPFVSLSPAVLVTAVKTAVTRTAGERETNVLPLSFFV